MTRRRALLAAAVAALSLLVHAKGLRAPLLDYHFHRQVNTASIARNYARESRPIHLPRVDWEGPADRMAATELPLQMWLIGKLWPLFGLGESWGRVLSALASALTALLLFMIFTREFGEEAGFYGAALFSFLPLEIYFGRTVQPEALSLLGLVGALYFWELSLEPRRPWLPWLAAVLCAFVAVGHKLPYAHALIPLAGLSFRRQGWAMLRDPRLYAAGLLSMGAVVAWYAWARTGVYVVPTHGAEFWRILQYERLPYFVQFLVFSRFLEIVATYTGAALFFRGAKEIWAERDAFWLSWFGGAFVHVVALGDYGHSHDYTALPLVPATAAFMGLGLLRFKQAALAAPPSRRRWALAGVFVLVLGVPLHAGLRIRHWYRQGFEYLADAGAAADAVSKKDDPFLTNCQAPSVALYYLDRRGWSEEMDLHGHEGTLKLIERRAKDGAKFLATEKRGLFADPDGTMWKEMLKRGKPVWDRGGLAIFALTPDAPAKTRLSVRR